MPAALYTQGLRALYSITPGHLVIRSDITQPIGINAISTLPPHVPIYTPGCREAIAIKWLAQGQECQGCVQGEDEVPSGLLCNVQAN